MPYIGKEPVAGNFVLLDSITTSATATYALTKDSVAYSPESARNMIVSLNGVTQAPEAAFTVSGSNITFSSALTSSDVIDYILVLGDVLSVGTPSDGTVGTSQMSYPLGNFSSTGIDDNATSTGITIDSSQNVGIGTTSPSTSLDVVRAGAQPLRVQSTSGTECQINMVNTGGSVQLEAHSGNFTIDAGNVGIGTTSPLSKLEVLDTSGPVITLNRNDTTIATDDVLGSIEFYDADGGSGSAGVTSAIKSLATGSNGASVLTLSTSNSSGGARTALAEAVRIDNAGNVGIGETSPATMLEVNGNWVSSQGQLTINAPSGQQYTGLALQNNGTAIGYLYADNTGNNTILYATASKGIQFYTNNSVSATITSAGNVGIGTTSPNEKLNVSGNIRVTSGFVSFSGSISTPSEAAAVYRPSDNTLAFSTANVERMRIDSVGNVGIGTNVPVTYLSNVSGSAKGLAIEGAVPVFALKDTSASDDISYIYQSTNDMRFLNYAGGEMTFRRGSGGTESMRIDSSGHLITPNGVTLGTSAGVYNAANTLDDYEEGSWNPSLSQGSATVSGARYVKVGRLVYVEALLTSFTNRSTAAAIQVGNLPFTSSSDCRAGNVSLSRFINRSSGTIVSYLGSSRNYAHFYAIVANADYEQVYHSHLSASNSNIYISITYEAA